MACSPALLPPLSIPFPIFLPTYLYRGRDGSSKSRHILEDTYIPLPVVNAQLVAGGPGPSFAFGFINRLGGDIVLAVFLVLTNGSGVVDTAPVKVVWTANRYGSLTYDYAALNLTADGDLLFSDGGGNLVWSSNTSGTGVASLNLTVEGNLMLVDDRSQVIWQSFNHPTDTALPNQRLTGMKLVANESDEQNTLPSPIFPALSCSWVGNCLLLVVNKQHVNL